MRLAGQAPHRRPPLSSNVRQPRVSLAVCHLRCAAMGREVTASSTARCPVASAALPRFVMALGSVSACSYACAFVVCYLATAPPSRLRPSLSKSLRARQPRHRAAQDATHRMSKSLRAQQPRAPCATGCPSQIRVSLLGTAGFLALGVRLPNPTVEWTSTGMALGPRSYPGHHTAPRATHHAGSGPSPQTLGLTVGPPCHTSAEIQEPYP